MTIRYRFERADLVHLDEGNRKSRSDLEGIGARRCSWHRNSQRIL